MSESNFEGANNSLENQLNNLLQQYEAEHGPQSEEQRKSLKEIWKNAFKDKDIEDTIEGEQNS